MKDGEKVVAGWGGGEHGEGRGLLRLSDEWVPGEGVVGFREK